MAIFHFTVKIVGRSKGKSVISASAYLNGDVMKNEETGRISYYKESNSVSYLLFSTDFKKKFLLRFSNEQKTTPNVLRKKKFVIGGGRYV